MSRILVIDDDYAIRLLYREELACEGYEVSTASDCQGILELIDKKRPDLIVMEVIIGQYNGLDLLQDIRNTYYNLPVILCTMYPAFKYDLKSIAADYYVIKSPDLSELKLKIKMAMESNVGFIETMTGEEIHATSHIPITIDQVKHELQD